MPNPYDEFEDGDDDYSDDTQDTLDEILKHYKFHFEPEVRLKWTKSIKNLSLSASYTREWDSPWQWRLMLKPTGEQKWGQVVKKILLVPSHYVALSTPKLKLGPLRLELEAFYNLQRKKVGLDYRLTTKWSDGPQLKAKHTVQPVKSVTFRAKHHLHFTPPVMSGHIGVDAEENEVDGNPYGSMQLAVTQLDLKFQLP